METTCKLAKMKTMKTQTINQKASYCSLLIKAAAKDCENMHSIINCHCIFIEILTFMGISLSS